MFLNLSLPKRTQRGCRCILVLRLLLLSSPPRSVFNLPRVRPSFFFMSVRLFRARPSSHRVRLAELIMAVGLVVDYMVHIVHYFLHQDPSMSKDVRIANALGEIGPSILVGSATTFLGIVSLAFASNMIFRTFFRMFIVIISFGVRKHFSVHLMTAGKTLSNNAILTPFLRSEARNQRVGCRFVRVDVMDVVFHRVSLGHDTPTRLLRTRGLCLTLPLPHSPTLSLSLSLSLSLPLSLSPSLEHVGIV